MTPQSTGIQETLLFTNSTYNLAQNGLVIDSGTYRTSATSSASEQDILSILDTNSRVADSARYYTITNNADSLIISHDPIGTVGSGSRHYVKIQ